MKLKSKILKDFIKEIQFKNRNPQDIKALRLLDDISTNPEILLNKGTNLYRCRIVTDKNKINKEEKFYGYGAKESFVPPINLTRDLRANYKYIPYLYCSNNPYISLVEVRPRMGSLVSIATIINNYPIRLLDFTVSNKPSKMTEAKMNLFSDLSVLYSTPIASDDDVLEYIPTQFIAEYVKNRGYDGIAFSSSLTPEINKEHPDRFNIVVFNYGKCSVIKSNVVEIQGIDVDGMQVDDGDELDIRSFINEKLDDIISYQDQIINGEIIPNKKSNINIWFLFLTWYEDVVKNIGIQIMQSL